VKASVSSNWSPLVVCALLLLGLACQKSDPPPVPPTAKTEAGGAPAHSATGSSGREDSTTGEKDPTDDGSAAPCQPTCQGRDCGDDGCGGSCGQCTGSSSCQESKCLCPQFLCLGECCTEGADCTAGGCCTPRCEGKTCGSDGCGGSCGACDTGVPCGAGRCVDAVVTSWPVDLRAVKVTASSFCPDRTEEYYGQERTITYRPEDVFDGRLETAWIECGKGPGVGEWMNIELGEKRPLTGLDLYIGYQRVEDDEHGDRYPLNTRPKQIAVVTDSQHFSAPLKDARAAQHIVLDGSPTSKVRITVQSAYIGKDKDCSISELVLFGKPTTSQLEAYDESALKPGMTLVYRDVGMDLSEFNSPDPEEVSLASSQDYTSVRLGPLESTPRGFTVLESEEASETFGDLSGYFWEAGQAYVWDGGGVRTAGSTGTALFPAAPTGLPEGLNSSGLPGTGWTVGNSSDDEEPGDQQYDARLNSRYGYVHTDGSGVAGVAASRVVTIVDTFPSAAQPTAERIVAATERLTARLEDWKKARGLADRAMLKGFYAGAEEAASARLSHAPDMAIVYQETATHIGPTRAFTSFQEMIAAPAGQVYVMRELEWVVKEGEFVIAAERIVHEKSFPREGGEVASDSADPSEEKPAAGEIPPAVMSAQEREQALVEGDLRKAKKLNTAGYRARKKGDGAAALAAYEQAVAAAPAYGRARLNYACELSLAGRQDEALSQLVWLYRTGRDEDLDLVAAATSDTDLRALWPRPRFKALIEGLAARRPYGARLLPETGCFGYAPATGAVSCGYVSDTSEWASLAGGVIFAAEVKEFAIRSEEEDMDDPEEMLHALKSARIAPVKLPHFKLREGREMPLGETGFAATWKRTDDATIISVSGPSGRGGSVELDEESLVTSGQPVMYNSPTSVVVWLVPGFDRFVVEAISEYGAEYEDGQMIQGAEHYTGLGFIEL
jgi:hypothetical protein